MSYEYIYIYTYIYIYQFITPYVFDRGSHWKVFFWGQTCGQTFSPRAEKLERFMVNFDDKARNTLGELLGMAWDKSSPELIRCKKNIDLKKKKKL